MTKRPTVVVVVVVDSYQFYSAPTRSRMLTCIVKSKIDNTVQGTREC